MKWRRGKRNMIVWRNSLNHTLKCKVPPSLSAYSPVEGAGKYEYLYQRGGIFSSDVALFLWPGKPMRLKDAVAAADHYWAMPPVLWQGVGQLWAHELDSSISTEGIDVPEEITRTLATEWESQGRSFWTIVLISIWYSTYKLRLGLHFSFREEKKSVIVFFYILSCPETPLYNEINVKHLFQVAAEDTVKK